MTAEEELPEDRGESRQQRFPAAKQSPQSLFVFLVVFKS